MEKQNLKKSIKFLVILFLVIFFGDNAIKFVTTEGSQHPLLSSLFNMILLICLIFVFHRKDAKFMMRQIKLEEFLFL